MANTMGFMGLRTGNEQEQGQGDYNNYGSSNGKFSATQFGFKTNGDKNGELPEINGNATAGVIQTNRSGMVDKEFLTKSLYRINNYEYNKKIGKADKMNNCLTKSVPNLVNS